MAGQTVAEVAGRKINSDEVVSRLKLAGEWYGAVDELSDEAQLAQAAKQEGVSVTDAELQEEFDAYRISRGLEQAETTQNWLKTTGLTIEDVEAFIEAGILRRKLAAKVIGDKEIEAYYKQNPREFEFAQISRIVVNDAGAANEIALSAREEGENFADLARQHSVDPGTKRGGGYVGMVTRRMTGGIPDDAADRLFAAKAGDVVGPFPFGASHCVVNVLESGKRSLDDKVKASLRDKLFQGWLKKRSGS